MPVKAEDKKLKCEDSAAYDELNTTTKSKKKGGSPFLKLGIRQATVDAVHRLGFRLPTPIQRRAIPVIVKNDGDVIAVARTGAGKTCMFVIPMLDRLEKHSFVVGSRALIVSPTRELAVQTGLVARKLCRGFGIRFCLLIGGNSMDTQFEKLSENPDVLLCTPGRLVHHMAESSVSLRTVEYVVIDEADSLFDMGFDSQMTIVMQALTCPKRQMIVTSATISPKLSEFVNVSLKSPSIVRLANEYTLSPDLFVNFFACRSEDKPPCLLYWVSTVLGLNEKVLIFAATRHHVEFLSSLFTEAGIPNAHVFGSLDQYSRNECMNNFRSGVVQILFVTDLAARGLDIPEIDHVLHFDFPCSPKLFVHRSGRTARNGRRGVCSAFVTFEDAPYLLELSASLGLKVSISSAKATEEEQKTGIPLAGFPNLDVYRYMYQQLMERGPTLPKLKQSVSSAEILYKKTRTPVSVASLKKARELTDSSCFALVADKIHPIFVTEYEDCKRQDNEAKAEPSEMLTLAECRTFRPTKTTTGKSGCVKGFGVSPETAAMLRKATALSRLPRMMQDFTSTRQAESAEVDPTEVDSSVKQEESSDDDRGNCGHRMSIAERRFLKRHGKLQWTDELRQKFEDERQARRPPSSVDQFVLSGNTGTIEDVLMDDTNSGAQYLISGSRPTYKIAQDLREITQDHIQDDRDKLRIVRKWDSKNKKYKLYQLDKFGKAKNEAGVKVKGDIEAKGLLKKWTSRTKVRMPAIGQPEEPKLRTADVKYMMSRRSEGRDDGDESSDNRKRPLSDFTNDQELIELVRTGGKLTKKQKKKLERVIQRRNNPIRTYDIDDPASSSGGLKTAGDLKKEKKRQIRRKIIQDKKYRTQVVRTKRAAAVKKLEKQGAFAVINPKQMTKRKGRRR